MLVLTRKKGERLLLGDSIRISIERILGDKVRIGIEAPRDLLIVRDELGPETVEALRARLDVEQLAEAEAVATGEQIASGDDLDEWAALAEAWVQARAEIVGGLESDAHRLVSAAGSVALRDAVAALAGDLIETALGLVRGELLASQIGAIGAELVELLKIGLHFEAEEAEERAAAAELGGPDNVAR
jgi:carbon storage regulator